MAPVRRERSSGDDEPGRNPARPPSRSRSGSLSIRTANTDAPAGGSGQVMPHLRGPADHHPHRRLRGCYGTYACRPWFWVGTNIMPSANIGWPKSGPVVMVCSTAPVEELTSVSTSELAPVPVR